MTARDRWLLLNAATMGDLLASFVSPSPKPNQYAAVEELCDLLGLDATGSPCQLNDLRSALVALRARVVVAEEAATRLKGEMREASAIVLRETAAIVQMRWAVDGLSDEAHDRLLPHIRALKSAYDIIGRPEADRQKAAQDARRVAVSSRPKADPT